jgi:hypothetical protein
MAQTRTKLQKRKAAKVNRELQALNAMRANDHISTAVGAYLVSVHLTENERDKLRAALAVLSHAPLTTKLLASL